MRLVAIVGAIVAVLGVLVLGRLMYVRWQRAAMGNGTFALRFVRIDDSGSVHELTKDEIDYLNTEFHPADGARPYIKQSYTSLTPDGRIGGFLLRRNVPANLLSRTKTEGEHAA